MTSKRKAGIARNRADRDQMRRARRTLAAGRQHQPGGRQYQPASRQPAAATPGIAAVADVPAERSAIAVGRLDQQHREQPGGH